ncbi:hypothetical protein SAY87_005338 [Trapa incisa]|uniref:Ran guanine nucleotide release factor n=1 Tax=Trapa incisa TaxID=236973 RepID=A0AAN7QBJ5_9MYRT|nr:hypothetical protein SAY87_005338 [Trapa incisa]
MASEVFAQRALFDGAITSTFPLRFEDVSRIRDVPDNQEVLVDPSRDESLIFELLEMKHDVPDYQSATWFIQDLANEQDAELCSAIQQSAVMDAPSLTYGNMPAVVTTAVGEMAISKGRQGREAQNIVRVYLADIRLRAVNTDVLIVAYEPLLIK